VRVTFGRDEKWTGNDGCNDDFGTYRIGATGGFHFKLIGGTKKRCFVASAPLQHLDATARATIVDQRLTFFATDGRQLARFTRGLSLQLELPTHTMPAGSTIAGHVAVDNLTGRELHPTGCGSVFRVVLGNEKVAPNFVSCAGGQDFTIPAGKSRYPVSLAATYLGCVPGPPDDNWPSCLPGSRPPPLPLGTYDAIVFEGSGRVSTSSPVKVQVVGSVGVTARIELPSRTMVAGSKMSGRVVVENDTGEPIHATGCVSLFQVALENDSEIPSIPWLTCGDRFTIPVGESSYPIVVRATALICSACPNGSPPPLPPGEYRATLFQREQAVPAPSPVTVSVMAR
jgi:META domain